MFFSFFDVSNFWGNQHHGIEENGSLLFKLQKTGTRAILSKFCVKRIKNEIRKEGGKKGKREEGGREEERKGGREEEPHT